VQGALLATPPRKRLERPPLLPKQHGKDSQQKSERGQSALCGIVNINIVQVAVIALRKGSVDPSRRILLHMTADALGADAKQGMCFDHCQPRGKGHHPVLVGIHFPVGAENGEEAVLHGRGAKG